MRRVNDEQSEMSRRRFLKAVGVTTSAGTAAVVVATAGPAVATAAPPAEAGRGYRETDHVRRVYSLSRF